MMLIFVGLLLKCMLSVSMLALYERGILRRINRLICVDWRVNIVSGVINGSVLGSIGGDVLIILMLGCVVEVSTMEMLIFVVRLKTVIDLWLRVMMLSLMMVNVVTCVLRMMCLLMLTFETMSIFVWSLLKHLFLPDAESLLVLLVF